MIKNRIDELLKENGLTFGALADLINVKRTTLLYQLSNQKVPLKYLIEIAKVLKIDVSELFEEDCVDIRGYVKYGNKFFDLNHLDDFVEFTNILARDCGLETDLYYQKNQDMAV